jgi:subtilisin family serine protease
MIKKVIFIFSLTFFVGSFTFAQTAPPKDWFHLNKSDGKYQGVSTKQLYQEILKGRVGQQVVVAVIDSGVDYEHEDLDDVMWVNEDEIPDNGKDDDNNGYIDDIHGWNYLGNASGENTAHAKTELMRLFVEYDKQFKDVDESSLSKSDKEKYQQYLSFQETIEQKKAEAAENAFLYKTIGRAAERLQQAIGKDEISMDDLQNFKSDNPLLSQVSMMLVDIMKDMGGSFEEIKDGLIDGAESFENTLAYYYNPEFNPREVIGDNPEDYDQLGYGNNDVRGPDSDHGTHVAGIIAAERDNGLGIEGIANNVRIMALRAVPDGDERDKDVALAIKYAVDNGAQVINMSFGKDYSPGKSAVDEAVKYALKNDVLLVHAAGNDNKEVFTSNNFPNDEFLKKGLFGPKYADNWVEVGAISWKSGEDLAAEFSNYSAENVDIFAPGVAIYSAEPGNEYQNHQGTSMAGPGVAGVAALVRSYFPDLTAKQVKEVLMQSAVVQNVMVKRPGADEGDALVPFKRLSVSGGVVDAVKAFEVARSMKGKNRKKADLRKEIWNDINP